ncbi:MAG: helix-turn-helix domain-containing protein [Sediminibacterium sp.]|jgi:AraC-like DNA-binding protein|nr:AraC family transcriptional regulator [Chitinophagaceae bacterium]MCA6446638.1 AraC family transcriptional regulator [Chitinophagaceae bacterium]
MICKRIQPAKEISEFIREYLLFHAVFDTTANIPAKSYPVNPEEGIIFLIRGSLIAESPELGKIHKRPKTFVFGIPSTRQNLSISNEYMMVCVRFQPGALFKLTGIPMTELVHNYIDAELILGGEIKTVYEQLANASNYESMPLILDNYFQRKIHKLKKNEQPIDKIGSLILKNPQGFNLEKTAGQAYLSHRQFEKRFIRQIGIPPKLFSRICRFNQAYELKEYSPHLNWFTIAIQTGYSDYQHLVKDFKQFTGTLPNTFIQECLNNPERVLNLSTDFIGV